MSDHESGRPSKLIVVGAVGGMARLITDSVLTKVKWDEVFLLDTRPEVHSFKSEIDGGQRTHRLQVVEATGDRPSLKAEDGTAVFPDGIDAVVWLAIPQAKIRSVAHWLLPRFGRDSVVFDIASEKSAAMAAMSEARPELTVFGTHPLFSFAVGTVSGQTLIICPSRTVPKAHEWLSLAVEEAGGTVKTMTAEEHDLAMTYVQTAAHQALVVFADVVGTSGLDLEDDLWASRTPQFETLLAMASRVLATAQVETIASIQLSTSGRRVVDEMGEALERLRRVIQSDSMAEIEDHLEGIGKRYPGAVFQRMQQASRLATSAVQTSRSSLARLRLTGELAGVATKNNPERLRVGHVTNLTTTSLEIENLLVGNKGNARLLGHNDRFASKLGIGGTKATVRFRIGNVDLFLGPDLEVLLERWLGSVSVYVSLVGPESVSGRAMCVVASDHPIVREVELVSDEVRFGRRQCLLRCFVRADRDPSNLAVELQARCDAIYASPPPVLDLPAALDGLQTVAYLGPPGTFSESAARAVRAVADGKAMELAPFSSFGELLESLRIGEVQLAVLPVCNSATGLVEVAAAALRDHKGELSGCGVVDVAVRFDAYGRVGHSLEDAKVVISQPQALMQCRRFINEHKLVERGSSSTIEALQRVAKGEGDVALAPAGSKTEPPTQVLQSNVGDLRGAFTRFIVLRSADGAAESPQPVGLGGAAASSDARTRSVWLLSASHRVPAAIGMATIDEMIAGESGLCLLISTNRLRVPATPGVRSLGSFVWSPGTPAGTF